MIERLDNLEIWKFGNLKMGFMLLNIFWAIFIVAVFQSTLAYSYRLYLL